MSRRRGPPAAGFGLDETEKTHCDVLDVSSSESFRSGTYLVPGYLGTVR